MNVSFPQALEGGQGHAVALHPAAGRKPQATAQPAVAVVQQIAIPAAPQPRSSSEEMPQAVENLGQAVAPVARHENRLVL